MPLLEVSTSGFYAWACRTPEPRTRVNARLQERIQIHEDSLGGSARHAYALHEDLADEGERVSVNRVAQLMPTQACRAGCGGASAASGGKPGARLSGVTNLLEREYQRARDQVGDQIT